MTTPLPSSPAANTGSTASPPPPPPPTPNPSPGLVEKYIPLVCKYLSRTSTVILLCLASLGVGFVGQYYVTGSARDIVLLLFFVPLAIQSYVLVIVGRRARSKSGQQVQYHYLPGLYALFLALGVISFLGFWIAYNANRDGEYFWLPCVVVAITLSTMALFVTSLLTSHRYIDGEMQELATELSRHSFYSVMFFFGAYLCSTYIIGIALASHDRWEMKHNQHYGLFAAEDSLSFTVQPGATATPDDRPVPGAASEPRCYRFYFREKTFALDEREWNKGQLEKVLKSGESRDEPLKESMVREEVNHKALRALYAEMESRDVKDTLLTIIGHTNTEPVASNSTYRSNYELASLRALRTRGVLREGLIKWVNSITFEIDERPFEGPQANDSKSPRCSPAVALDDEERKFLKDDWLTASVFVADAPHHRGQAQLDEAMKRFLVACKAPGERDRDLLTYIYFAITGRDFVAATWQARFIAAVATLLGVVFLVIVLSSLVSSAFVDRSKAQP